MTVVQSGVGRGSSSGSSATTYSYTPGNSLDLQILQGMGTSILAQSGDTSQMTTTATLANTAMRLIKLETPVSFTMTGFCFYQQTQGSYTAANTNQMALYTSDGTNFTRVAATADNGNLWKGAANTFIQEPLTSTFPIVAGTGYWAAMLYCSSVQPTAPVVGCLTAPQNLANSKPTNGNVTMTSTLAAQTSCPAGPTAWAGVTATANRIWVGLY